MTMGAFEIYCPIDKEFVTVPEKLRENRRMIDKLQSLNQHTVFCDEHEGQITNQYCTRCQIPICSHSEHSLLDLKPSSFKIYIDNVVKLLDEYSIENVKTQLIRLSNNESQLNSQDFKEIISKINRMLGKVLIDSTQSLEDPLYAPQNRNFQRSNVIEELGSQNNSNPQNIQQMINDSQSQLREEFRQQLRALEINQNQLNNEINGLDHYEQTLEEFKTHFDTILIKCNEIEIAFSTANTKLSNIEQTCQLQQDLNYDYFNKLKLLQNEVDKTKNQLSEFIQTIKLDIYNHDTLLVDANAQIINERVLIDTLQLKIGSRDGFIADKFHELCDDKGPTVSFILSEYGQVFGGFTSVSWTSSNYDNYSDSTAFVFSLSKRSVHKQYQNQQEAVYHNKDGMCVFGGGYAGSDIAIFDNFDKDNRSYCDLGGTYELPNEYKFQSSEAQSYLGGQLYFNVLEIEVYSLI
eukprot:403336102